jgi:hypothetical protein
MPELVNSNLSPITGQVWRDQMLYLLTHSRQKFRNNLNADIAMIFRVMLSTDATQDGCVAFGRKRTQSRDKSVVEVQKDDRKHMVAIVGFLDSLYFSLNLTNVEMFVYRVKGVKIGCDVALQLRSDIILAIG